MGHFIDIAAGDRAVSVCSALILERTKGSSNNWTLSQSPNNGSHWSFWHSTVLLWNIIRTIIPVLPVHPGLTGFLLHIGLWITFICLVNGLGLVPNVHRTRYLLRNVHDQCHTGRSLYEAPLVHFTQFLVRVPTIPVFLLFYLWLRSSRLYDIWFLA